MIYQIDQSGKVEDTRKLTIVALANRKVKSLKISAVEKRKLLKAMRVLDYPKKTFVFKIFTALVFLLIREERIKDMERVIIDKEYPGHEGLIKDLLLYLFKKENRQVPVIHFAKIGRESIAHKVALEVFRGERKPDMIIETEDVMQLLYKK